MRLFILLLAPWFLAQGQDTPSNFMGSCTVKAIRNVEDTKVLVWRTVCRCEDLPATGFNNRFRLTFYGDAPEGFALPRIADFVRAESSRGTLIVRALLWGEVVMTPISGAIREQFMRDGYEVRPQHLGLGKGATGATELVIDEPWGEFTGKVALAPWMEFYSQAIALLGHAK